MTKAEILEMTIAFYKELVALGADREAVAVKELVKRITK